MRATHTRHSETAAGGANARGRGRGDRHGHPWTHTTAGTPLTAPGTSPCPPPHHLLPAHLTPPPPRPSLPPHLQPSSPRTKRTMLTNSSKPRRTPTNSTSPRMMTHSRRPMHVSISSSGSKRSAMAGDEDKSQRKRKRSKRILGVWEELVHDQPPRRYVRERG